MPFVESPDARLHYNVVDLTPPWVADPPTILLHHGLGTTVESWAEWVPLLAGRYRIVQFDMRGCGRSEVPPEDASWRFDLLAEDVFAVADAAGVERFHFVGESLGGIVAYYLASHRPERLRTVTSITASHQAGWLRGGVADWGTMLEKDGIEAWSRYMMEGRFRPEALTPAARDWYHREQSRSVPHVLLAGSGLLQAMDLRPHLARIETPILLLIGEASAFVPVEAVIDIRDAIGEAAELHVVAGARHGVIFSHPRHCCDVIEAFIARHPEA